MVGSSQSCVQNRLRYLSTRHENIMIDGLFLTNESLCHIIKAISACFSVNIDVTIHHWNEDRDICIKNDGGRRETPSTNTILHSTYEEVNINWLNDQLTGTRALVTKVEEHKVKLKEDWIRCFNPHVKFDDDGKLRSERWCTGGTYGNCWNDHKGVVDPDEPKEFIELDSLLEQICPGLTFLQYKKILRLCVTTEENREGDYYGGACYYTNWVCDMKELYKQLNEFGYSI